MPYRRALLLALLSCACSLPLAAFGQSSEEEINALIAAVESSGCQFIRNGQAYTAAAAAEHLRLKYRKGKAYASSAEGFIDNLASQSSFSKKPYFLVLPAGETIPSGVWLHQQLKQLRANGQKT